MLATSLDMRVSLTSHFVVLHNGQGHAILGRTNKLVHLRTIDSHIGGGSAGAIITYDDATRSVGTIQVIYCQHAGT